MLKDIDFKKVEDTAIAAVPKEDDIWSVYVLNRSTSILLGVFISSVGYGTIEDKNVRTTPLRHLVGDMEPNSAVKIEGLTKDLLQLTNEFWISYKKEDYLYDKKYVFVQESLTVDNLIYIPILDKEGVLIK